MLLAVGFSYVAFTMLRYVPSMPILSCKLQEAFILFGLATQKKIFECFGKHTTQGNTVLLFPFLLLLPWLGIPKIILNKSGKSGYAYIFSYLRGNAFSFLPLSMLLAMVFIMLCYHYF